MFFVEILPMRQMGMIHFHTGTSIPDVPCYGKMKANVHQWIEAGPNYSDALFQCELNGIDPTDCPKCFQQVEESMVVDFDIHVVVYMPTGRQPEILLTHQSVLAQAFYLKYDKDDGGTVYWTTAKMMEVAS